MINLIQKDICLPLNLIYTTALILKYNPEIYFKDLFLWLLSHYQQPSYFYNELSFARMFSERCFSDQVNFSLKLDLNILIFIKSNHSTFHSCSCKIVVVVTIVVQVMFHIF